MTSTKLRIMVVDDEPDVVAVLRAFLEPEFEMVEADNGLDALLRAPRFEPDLLIVDLMLPVMDGWEFARRVRAIPEFRDTPMIFLTALDSRECIERGYQAGANLYLTKPFEPDRVVRNVEVFAERTSLTPRPKRFTVKELREAEATGEPPRHKETVAPASPAEPPRPAPREHIELRPQPPSRPPAPPAAPPRTAPSTAASVAPPLMAPSLAPPVTRSPSVPPAAPTPPTISSPPPAHAPATAKPGHETAPLPRIMVVDDDPEVAELLRSVLEPDFEVVTARDGLEAVQRIKDYEPDVVILDIMLPKLSGFQILQMLRQTAETAITPVIVLTAKGTERDRDYAANIGANAYITKPFMVGEVLGEIRRWMKRPGFTIRSPKKKSMADIYQEETQQYIVELQRKKLHLLHETESIVADFLHHHGDRGPFSEETRRP